jgi:hypothetical protein
LAMALSSVFVIFNSLRLSHFPEPPAMELPTPRVDDLRTTRDTAPVVPKLVGAES